MVLLFVSFPRSLSYFGNEGFIQALTPSLLRSLSELLDLLTKFFLFNNILCWVNAIQVLSLRFPSHSRESFFFRFVWSHSRLHSVIAKQKKIFPIKRDTSACGQWRRPLPLCVSFRKHPWAKQKEPQFVDKLSRSGAIFGTFEKEIKILQE